MKITSRRKIKGKRIGVNKMRKRIIDIHNHMLPEVDDGSYSMTNSIEMARLSVESGVTDVICTPHSYPGLFENYKTDEFMRRFAELDYELKKRDIALKIHSGMEIFGTENTAELLKENKLCTLAGSDYILLEFDFDDVTDNIMSILSKVINTGRKVIIAHPERYKCVARTPAVLLEWLDMGCLLQCNKESIRGKFGKMVNQIAMDMLADHLYSFVGSDAHGATHRSPYMEFAYNKICDDFGEKYADELFFINPQNVLENSLITV